MKILHIENDPDYSYHLREGLETFGFEVINFDEPDEAIVHFKANSNLYDVIICDGDPGIMDGTDVVAALRNINAYIPIVAQCDFPKHVQRMFDNGATWGIPRTLKETDFAKFQTLMRDLTLRFPRR